MKQFSATGVGGKRVLFVNKKITPKPPISPSFCRFRPPLIFSLRRGLESDSKAWMPLHPARPSRSAVLEQSLSAALHEIRVLKQEIAALRRQLGKDSSNSGKSGKAGGGAGPYADS